MAFYYVLDEDTEILIADDDPIQREFATVYLASPHAQITTAANGRDALHALEQSHFDIVLLDVEMPVMDGFETLRRIRASERFSEMPVVMITGLEDIQSIDRAYELGATSFIVKPVNWRLLTHQLKYLLRMSRQKRQSVASMGEALG